MIAFMRNLAITAAVMAMLVCSTRAQQPGQAINDQDPVAVVGGLRIMTREVDERWQAGSPAQHLQIKQALYDGRRAALDAIVADFLVARAAAAKGVTREQFEADEVGRRAPRVTDEDVAAFYRENRNQMEGRWLQEISGARPYEAFAAVIDDELARVSRR